ncbi:MAG: RNB domain-containing ribonuclease, partial [Herbiconiux sp.]|nr:RNB domain-containing ribonuclease [Herbiconiux sp.]
GAASLLPGADRLAVLWTLTIDATGELTGTQVERATVRSREQLDYAGAEAALARGDAHPQLTALAELGPLLIEAAGRRGAIELPEPAQELGGNAATGWALQWVPRRAVEEWNAQLSLTTGRAAAALMLSGRSGLLRTLPPAPADAQPRLRVAAAALGVDWPEEESLSSRLARLDSGEPAHLALIDQARTLLRGAGYLPLAGEAPTPDEAVHAAVASPYAHVTAPLRRLGDRFATEAALAVAAGAPVPTWVADGLPGLPEILTASGRRSGAVNRAVLDLAEALVLGGRVGETFDAAVVEVVKGKADVRIESPPVLARAEGAGLVAGTRATVALTGVDPVRRKVAFAAAPAAPAT